MVVSFAGLMMMRKNMSVQLSSKREVKGFSVEYVEQS